MGQAEIEAADIDYIICATFTPDLLMPSAACLIQDRLGAKNAAACDLNAACSGFVYSLEIADALIRAGVHKTILIIGAEEMTARVDWTKRDTAVLFGDGAGAVVVRGEEGERGVLTTFTASDGSGAEILSIPVGGARLALTPENIHELDRGIRMNGRELYKRAVFAFGDAAEKALSQAGVSSEDIDLFIPHQANRRIIVAATERIGLPEEKIYLNLDRVANTSSASIPIALDEALTEGRIHEGDLILFAAFGAGLTWASALIRW
jgi:3-oxoacyl-[acyl-carrier-protein] synthase-3